MIENLHSETVLFFGFDRAHLASKFDAFNATVFPVLCYTVCCLQWRRYYW